MISCAGSIFGMLISLVHVNKQNQADIQSSTYRWVEMDTNPSDSFKCASEISVTVCSSCRHLLNLLSHEDDHLSSVFDSCDCLSELEIF